MIDSIGGRPLNPWPAAAAPQAKDANRAEPAWLRPQAGASLSRLARDLAASPPVDAGKVARLKTAIAAGLYTIDADAIAARMIALEKPFRA